MRVVVAGPVYYASVKRVLVDAFGGDDEASLVDELRAAGDAAVELVALDDQGRVAGHVMFSNLRIECDGGAEGAVALAPLAVRLDCRNQGAGGLLVTHGLDACRQLGKVAAVVLGDPGYYGRFGFSGDATQGFSCVFEGPYLQALELAPGALQRGQGRLIYARAFDRFSDVSP